MGKQIYFVHTEVDILPLLTQIEGFCGKIIINGVFYSPQEMLGQVISAMTNSSTRYSIVFVPDNSPAKWDAYACVGEGTAIQFSNCWKWSNESHTYYDHGRIYLAPTKQGIYDRDLLALYKKLHSYFKKNYCLHKKPDLYVSHSFKDQYLMGNLDVSQLGHPYPVRLFENS